MALRFSPIIILRIIKHYTIKRLLAVIQRLKILLVRDKAPRDSGIIGNIIL